ncbi:hypothetical protein [Mariniblastus fucicola]|uniref:Uncharacterized protein n=1 Tax=Mariniblastus fucicola TaxID=980251 RepID=A0A5B9PEE6_9BACT|nr:hypothetical protein [Mariniblastus fucicola]QEG23530.1 hypothetical protein MFFC18_34310 [Mariniblastus fucicola]
MNKKAQGNPVSARKPIVLYDHLPGILAGYPAVLFSVLGVVSFWSGVDPHMMFWIGLSIMLVWYVAFRFNMPKSKFWMLFGLLGTFIGIPVVLEMTGIIRPFYWLGMLLGSMTPAVNTGAWFVMAMVFAVIWIGNFVWSRTHLKVTIDESGLTLNRLGGKGERFELIGLKTENEPLDYLELFLCGVGSLSLKTRMNKPIFKMHRVVGLYRTPWFPFFKSKLSRIEEMLSYQGKVYAVDSDRLDAAEQADSGDADFDDELFDESVSDFQDFDAPEAATR